jgi:tetratricopeptide (TPR) repeat protein
MTSGSIAVGDTSLNNYYLKALSEVQLGKKEEAVFTLQQALDVHKDNPRLSRMLAGQYFEAGDYVNANRIYSTLVDADSTDQSSWLKMAEAYTFRHQYSLAIKSLERVLELDSLNLSSLMMMGDIFSKLNDSIAVSYFERAYNNYPQNQKVAYALGNWYIQSDTPDRAIPVCKEILALDSTNIRFLKLLGFAYYKAGDPRHSIENFHEANMLGDSSLFLLKFMGISQYLISDFERAIAYLQAGTDKDSMDAEIHFFLGASLATTTSKEEAMNHLNRSLKLMKPDPSVVSRIFSEQGNIMRLETKYDSAYYFYEQAWETDSTNLMALYFMASILDNSMHLSREALKDYQRFIEQLDLQPDAGNRNSQMPTIRSIVEDRIISLREELFFLDEDR